MSDVKKYTFIRNDMSENAFWDDYIDFREPTSADFPNLRYKGGYAPDLMYVAYEDYLALQAKLDKAMVGVREEKTFFDTCMCCNIVLFCEDKDSHNDVDGILCDECYRSCLDDGSVEATE